MNVIDRINDLKSYTSSTVNLGDENWNNISEAVSLIHTSSPLEQAGVFSKMERLINASDNLSYIVLSLIAEKSNYVSQLRSIKDPKYTILVRQGRPSGAAIDAEIRMMEPSISEIERHIDIIDNFISYLSSIEKNIDRYIWDLRDKNSYARK